MSDSLPLPPKGRGAGTQPPNRFAQFHAEPDLEQLQSDDELLQELRRPATEFLEDDAKSIVSENDSPDIHFRYSLNPYRGCEHGCSYCYARPFHEYLGFSAGLDFETKILVKRQAPLLLRRWLARPGYRPEWISFSGATDCYQPAERKFQLTRGCLQVACDAGQPVGVITKNALVARDLDILAEMAKRRTVHAVISVTTLDAELARTMEPRTSTPNARLRAMQTLAEAGVPTAVIVAPIIPGLTDSEIPMILEAAKAHGASAAYCQLLRLPLTVLPVFREWLARTQPDRKERIEARIQSTRGGKWNESEFGKRGKGEGLWAEQIRTTFRVFAKKHGLDGRLPEFNAGDFRPPTLDGQGRLF
ncbi:MAG TPA: PA0069 family radical SAM protein [Pirellulales bacterium]